MISHANMVIVQSPYVSAWVQDIHLRHKPLGPQGPHSLAWTILTRDSAALVVTMGIVPIQLANVNSHAVRSKDISDFVLCR